MKTIIISLYLSFFFMAFFPTNLIGVKVSKSQLVHDFIERYIQGHPQNDPNHPIIFVDGGVAQQLAESKLTWFDFLREKPSCRFEMAPSYKRKLFRDERAYHRSTSMEDCLNDQSSSVYQLINDVLRTFPDSIANDWSLLYAIYKYMNETGKTFLEDGFAGDQLLKIREHLRRGEEYIRQIETECEEICFDCPDGHCDDNCKKKNARNCLAQIINQGDGSFEGISSSEIENFVTDILWYMQALSGQQIVLNPYNWNPERRFVTSGSFRFQDRNGHQLYNILKVFSTSYIRTSTHYPKESVVREKMPNFLRSVMEAFVSYNDLPTVSGFDHKGLDIKGEYQQPQPLPGKPGASTLLFGKLKDNQTFFKTETHGCNFQKFKFFDWKENLSVWKESALHGASLVKCYLPQSFRETESSSHTHKEKTSSAITSEFQALIDEKQEEVVKESKDHIPERGILDQLEQYKKDGKDYGIKGMIDILASSPLLAHDKEAQTMKRALQNYVATFCVGELTTMETIEEQTDDLKGCESVIKLFKNHF